MKLELIKTTKINGEVWYYIKQDGWTQDCILGDEKRAREVFEHLKSHPTVEGSVLLDAWVGEEISNTPAITLDEPKFMRKRMD